MKMKKDRFAEGEYLKKEDVMTFLRVLNWNMPREELIKEIDGIPFITLTEEDICTVLRNKMWAEEV